MGAFMAVIKILIIFLFVFVIPVILGTLITGFMSEKYKNSLTAALTIGVMMMFALFQLVTLPIIITLRRFSYVLWLYLAVIGVMLIWAVVCGRKRIRPMFAYTWKKVREAGFVGLLALILVLFQAGFLALNLHYDDDDARYVPSIVSAVEKDTMFIDNPITGETMYWDISETAKDMVSPWTIFWAVLSKLCMIHPAIVCHTIVPMLYIPIACLMYVMMGKELFADDSKRISVFVILVSLLHIYSGYSVFNGGAFLLFRIWQGKALFVGMVLPFLFWLALKFFHNDFCKKECLLTLTGCMAAAMTTGFGIFLAPMLWFICMVVHCLMRFERWDLYVIMAVTMLPNVIYAVLYVYGQNLFMF